MDSLDVARACVRRWYVVVPIVVLAVSGGYKLAAGRSATYTAGATITLYYPTQVAPPTTAGTPQVDPRSRNPLFVTGGVGLLTTSLVSDMNSLGVQGILASEGHHSAVSIAQEKQNGNLIDIASSGTDAHDVVGTVNAAVDLAGKRLVALQDRLQAPSNAQYRTFVVTPASAAVQKLPSKLKYVAAISGLGVLLAAAAALLLDGVSERRRRKVRQRRRSEAVDALFGEVETIEVSHPTRSSTTDS